MTIIIFYLGLCIAAACIAQEKGRSFASFFFLSILLSPIIGIISALVAQPDRAALELKEVTAGNKRTCPYCAENVNAAATLCRYCRSDLPEVNPYFAIATEPNVNLVDNNPLKYSSKWNEVKALFWIISAVLGLLFILSSIGEKLINQLSY